jgi:uncharacterized protein
MNTQTEGYRAKAFEPRNLVFFFLLAFGLSWISAVFLEIFDLKTPDSITDPAAFLFVFFALLGSIGPSLAAFIMTGITEGKPGVKALWKRFWNRNLSLKWLLVTLLFYDAVLLVANLVARTIDGQTYPFVDLPDPFWTIIPISLSLFISSGMGEEFGWRGYVLPRFQAKWNALTSSIILGLIWASWHIPFFFITSAGLYQKNFWEWVPQMLLGSVIYTWIFNNTKGSVLAAALFHASFNTTVVVLPTSASQWYYYEIMLLVVILIVIIFGPKNLVRQQPEGTTSRERVQASSV